jgi:hypothetical protein
MELLSIERAAGQEGRGYRMGKTREIPTSQWKAFLNQLSERNQGRPVRLETTVAAGEGAPVIAEHRPFLGVAFETKGSEAPAITVTLGGLDPDTPQSEHVISEPTRLWAREDTNGLGVALEVESREEGKTILSFEREAALPR